MSVCGHKINLARTRLRFSQHVPRDQSLCSRTQSWTIADPVPLNRAVSFSGRPEM